MTYGYSQSLVDAIQTADPNNVGMAFGRFCVSMGIPATQVAKALNVSRMTVYNWFWGEYSPSRKNIEQIDEFIRQHTET
jgi:DNA invertase Pin-like site-specific DNA recombinase